MAEPLEDMESPLEALFPSIARWVFEQDGLIEIGYDDQGISESSVRVLDTDGVIWESNADYDSLDELMEDVETFLESELPDLDEN